MKSNEFTAGPDVGECKTSYSIGPSKKIKSVCKYVIHITIQNNDDYFKCFIIIVIIIIIMYYFKTKKCMLVVF